MPTSYHVIIADDDDTIRSVIARAVVRTYPSVTISAMRDGLEALHVYDQQGADLVITNSDMPNLNGLGLIMELRARQTTAPILMVSADPAIKQQVLALGISGFLEKPFLLPQLLQTLVGLLAP